MVRIAIIFVVVAGALIGFLVWQQTRELPFVASGLIEADEIRVGSRIGGRVLAVRVEEGATVKKQEILYELDPFDLKEDLARVEAQAAAARADYDRLKAGFRTEEIEQARARRDMAQARLDELVAGPRTREVTIAREELKAAQARLELAESEFARLNRLVKDNQAAQREIDTASSARKSAAADVARADAAVGLLEEGTRKEEIAASRAALAEATQGLKLVEAGARAEDIARAEAQLASAMAQIESIKVQLAELSVVSPCDCLVSAIDLRPGDLVAANAPSAALLDLTRMWVRAYVPESRLGDIDMGQRVAMQVAGAAGRSIVGRITFIAHNAEFTPRNVQTTEERSKQVFRIKVRLDEGEKNVRVGMSADLHFDEPVPDESRGGVAP